MRNLTQFRYGNTCPFTVQGYWRVIEFMRPGTPIPWLRYNLRLSPIDGVFFLASFFLFLFTTVFAQDAMLTFNQNLTPSFTDRKLFLTLGYL